MHLNPLAWDYQMWRVFFVLSALWNFFFAFTGIIWPIRSLKRLCGVENPEEITIILYRSSWMSVLIFGIGYLIIAWDPGAHTGLVIVGIIGKIIASLGWFALFSKGMARKPAFWGAVGDAIFSVFFILYLCGEARVP